MLRRIVTHPLVRLVIALVIFVVLSMVLSLAIYSLRLLPAGMASGEATSGLAGIAALLFVGLVIERRSLARIGFPADRLLPDLGRGFLLGAALLTLVVGVMALAGWYRVVGFAWEMPGEGAAMIALAGLGVTLLIGIAEEVVTRGILFRILEEWLGSWIALALSALAFGLAHLANPNASLWAGIAIAIEAGILFGAVYIFSRALWLPIGLHWSWNFFEGWVYGTPVSGLTIPGLIRSQSDGPTLWTGGAFGPEAGLVAVVLCGGAGIYFIVRCVREGRMLTPPWLARLIQPSPSGRGSG
jgi:CAAX protease family protein